jgi:hypothetical protein
MDILLDGGCVLALRDEDKILENGQVLIQGGEIVDVGVGLGVRVACNCLSETSPTLAQRDPHPLRLAIILSDLSFSALLLFEPL